MGVLNAPVVATLFLLAAWSGSVAADHSQDAQTDEVSFQHVGGNAWWVEVDVTSQAGAVDRVEAQDEGGEWVPLEKRSWGPWAGSFHIEPGHEVRFRASGTTFTIHSCWFTHPDGVEQCQGSWHKTTVARAGAGNYPWRPLVVDVDDDGHNETLVPTTDGVQVYAFDGGWRLRETLAAGHAFGNGATGDLDGDGAVELVLLGGGATFTRFAYEDGWQTSHFNSSLATRDPSLTVGDPDDDGVDAVYLGEHFDRPALVEVRLEAGGFVEEQIATRSGGIQRLTVGDGNADGDLELYTGGGQRGNDEVFQFDKVGGVWTQERVHHPMGANGIDGLVVGDADNDGRSGLYFAGAYAFGHGQAIFMSTYDGGWKTEKLVDLPDYPRDLELADADGDGDAELYFTTQGFDEGHHSLYSLENTTPGWRMERLATVGGQGTPHVSAGDGDGDGLLELYLSVVTRNGRITEVSEHPPGAQAVSFDHTGGNAWWVQVRITGAEPGRVQAMDDGGPWEELELRTWGDWAASFPIQPGHDVRFRALLDDGAWHTSCWFTHPDGRTPGGGETCGSRDTLPPSPGENGFDASFSTSGGNEWWVEVYVEADEPLQGVHARDDGGPWVALDATDWGSWARSFHVEDGSEVQFAATGRDGDLDISGVYMWPEGRQVSEEPEGDGGSGTGDGGGGTGDGGDGTDGGDGGGGDAPGVAEIAFGPKASNEWWIETMAIANGTLSTVEARADGGAWQRLERKDWGSWAASFHAPQGSIVTFRGTLADGTQAVSAGFVWPQADVAGGGGGWPEEGSYAYYDVSWGISGTDTRADVEATFVHHDGRWLLECRGTDAGGSSHFTFARLPPPVGPSSTSTGSTVVVEHRAECLDGAYSLTVEERRFEDTHQDGDPVTADAWYGFRDLSGSDYHEAAWDAGTGIVLGWHDGGTEFDDGLLLDTDAPIS